jgi:hypothetical protein
MNQRTIERQPDAGLSVLFVHSSLDDLGLEPEPFRVYCHLSRRAGTGYAFPGLNSVAAACKINVKTARRAIQTLKELRMVDVQERAGHTSLYTLTASKEWVTPTTLTPTVLGRTTTSGRTTPTVLGRTPLPFQPYEGNTLKEIPKKVIHKLDDDAERIYNLYPRKIGSAGAIKAITKAIKDTGNAAAIEAATKSYAKAVAAWPEDDKKFIPFPSTWFNRGSYEDDPGEWERKPDKRFDAPKQKPLIEITTTEEDPFFS